MGNVLKLPLHGDMLNRLDQGILFVHRNGEILQGNYLAYQYLELEEASLSKKRFLIDDYLDFQILKEKDKSHIKIKIKEEIIHVDSVKMTHEIFFLTFNTILSLNEFDYFTDQIEQFSSEISEGLIIFKQDTIYKCDFKLATLFGYSPDEMSGMKLSELIKLDSICNDQHQFVDLNKATQHLVGVKKQGKTFFLEMLDYPFDDKYPEVRIGIVKDVSERIEHEERLRKLAYYNDISGLPNLNLFQKTLEKSIKHTKFDDEIIDVYFVQFNYFKELNEIFGYHFGNKLVNVLAGKLKSIENSSIMVAHINADDFVILNRHTKGDANTEEIPKNLIAKFQEPIIVEGRNVYVTLSIGMSSFPPNGSDSNRLIKLAESAMYSIRDEYQSSYKQFELSISQNSLRILAMENDLREALKKKQFTLHYQPQINIHTKEIIGMEALLRWTHPTKGNISPLDFIPFAEKTGLIIEIGDWVLKEACRQNKDWQDKGFDPIVVSVNLSAKQFHETNLVSKIEHVLEEIGLLPQYLELEITESMAMANETFILTTLHRLRNLGVLISIDDFGTGYSSLKYLSLFPITKLKIDKIFMDDKLKQNRSIVKSIINMSHSLNMKVIAEGVETKEQLNYLINERCDEMQGFYFSKPLPPKDVIVHLNKNKF